MMRPLKEIVLEYAKDTDNAELNFELALTYQDLGHTASAATHYIRAAERGSDLLAYESLLRSSYCYDSQKERDFTVRYLIKQAICLLPRRVEAYYVLAKYLLNAQEYADAYFHLKLAEEFCDWDLLETEPLRTDVGYKGKVDFYMDYANGAWFWDKYSEARAIMRRCVQDDIWDNANDEERQMIKKGVDEIGVENEEVIYKMWYKDTCKPLAFPFPGSENLERNYSQCYQDLFVLYMNNGKKDGTFLEIGAGPAVRANNTYLLETKYDWTGVSIENDPKFADEHNRTRESQTIFDDALIIDYERLIDKYYDTEVIDYLQLDIDPSPKTFECLLSIPFDKYKFRVITYEHDHYVDWSKTYKKKSRKYLEMMGYELVIGDVSPEGSLTFEDWWVHPDLVDRNLIEKIKRTNGIVNIKEHMEK